MEKHPVNLDLDQAQRFRSLTYLSANLAAKLSKPLPKEEAERNKFEVELRNLSVELSKAAAGDKKLFAALMPDLNKFIEKQSKIESAIRKEDAAKRKAENHAKRIENLRKKIATTEAKIKNAKPDDLAKLNTTLEQLRKDLATALAPAANTTTTKQPNGMGEKSGN